MGTNTGTDSLESVELDELMGPVECDDETCERLRAAAPTTADLFQLLGKAHTLPLLYEISREGGAWRFNEIKDAAEVNQQTLSRRLDELVEAGLLTRQSYDEIPPRVEYEATELTQSLKPALHYIRRWAEVNERVTQK